MFLCRGAVFSSLGKGDSMTTALTHGAICFTEAGASRSASITDCRRWIGEGFIRRVGMRTIDRVDSLEGAASEASQCDSTPPAIAPRVPHGSLNGPERVPPNGTANGTLNGTCPNLAQMEA